MVFAPFRSCGALFHQSRLVFQFYSHLGHRQPAGVENQTKELGFAGLGVAK